MKPRNLSWIFCSVVFLIGARFYTQAADISDIDAAKEFRARADQYAKLHRTVESKLPALPQKATAEQITAHQRALAAAIREARSTANRGDVFSTAEAYIRRTIAAELKGKEGLTARQMIKEENPTQPMHDEHAQDGSPRKPMILSINAPYPSGAPLSTVPPTMLLRLPPLPDELNYRFVGRHLILHDTHADMIIDFIFNVTP